MASKPILKMVKPGLGYDVNETDLRRYLFHSDYTMFKLHAVSGGNITINAGVQSGYVDISHTLGYIPAFLVYVKIGDTWQLFPTGCRAYITTTGVRVTFDLGSPYNYDTINFTAPNDLYDEHFGARSYTVTGHKDGNGRNHAIKFDGLAINQGASIVSASLEHYAETRWVSSPAQDMKLKTYGIYEDNTGDFGSNPMGRQKTTAVTSQNVVVPGTGEYFSTGVTDIVQEIVNRAGWASGNNMGFLVYDDNGPDGNALEDDNGHHKLDITVSLGGSITYPVKVVIFKDKIA